MTESKRIRTIAVELGWQLVRQNGKHEIWQSLSGNRIPLPSTPGKARTIQNAIAQLKRLA
ncbi:MAG: hypothetical protein DCF25_05985 [Leptolyngbya foveolarum]|uniref:Addiction module toxin, HicA family n=1 Tax=Leptolyngbya foveolarum TaxID=47253 RepID=A0A2W4UVI5_9CYAN|nr:MAG: hypothetical protein DCF25_05985 [Leptolyngbya foveolarum]